MFKRLGLCVLVMLAVLALQGQVSVLFVVDEDKHSKKEDFWHTFEYYIVEPGKTNAGKCQATRIAKNWFATAAHCVADRCKNGCTLRMDLLEQPTSVFVSAKHTAKKPIIFVHPSYSNEEMVAHDFALLHMDIANLPSRYYVRATEKQPYHVDISRAQFLAFLDKNTAARREFYHVMHPDLPPILIFDDVTRRIDRTLSVISIFDGKRDILKDPYEAYYVKDLGFAYTQNFGIKQGMSGSGVMTNTGELAGIISAYLTITIGGNEKSTQYFMFAVFNPELTRFMEETMGSDYYKMDRKDASPNYVTRSKTGHSEIIQAVHRLQKKK